MNLTEKIVKRFAVDVRGAVRSGDFVSIRPRNVMTHDNTAPVLNKFRSLGASLLNNRKQAVFTLDHDIQNTTPANLDKYDRIEAFAQEQGVDFYGAGRGIGHQIMVEEGYAFPGAFVVASDSHSNMYGGMGCLGTPVVRTDAAAIWATGKTWWQVPPVVRVELHGTLQPGVSAKDVILTLCGEFNQGEVLNHALEFTGPGVESLSIDERLTIANMTTEWGALTGLFPVDGVTLEWVQRRKELLHERASAQHDRINDESIEELQHSDLRADSDATYAKHIRLDLSTVEPSVAGPNSVALVRSMGHLHRDTPHEELQVDKAYLLSCTNSRASDIEECARVMGGRKVAPGVQFYVAAASSEVQEATERSGHWQQLLEAGAVPLPAGCGPCIGMGAGLLEDGEVGISATNRNFKGRMGSPDAQCYLASPAVVAESVVQGRIVSPSYAPSSGVVASIETPSSVQHSDSDDTHPDHVPGFPDMLHGTVVWCAQDDVNTDGIYPGKYTYRDDLTPQEMADVAMENYDADFSAVFESGDVLVSGANFGCGSSREQAATALKYKGVSCVIASSFSATYCRNAFNNGLLVLESPLLVAHLKEHSTPAFRPALTSRLQALHVNLRDWTVAYDGHTFDVKPIGTAVQELVVKGSLENWVKDNLTSL